MTSHNEAEITRQTDYVAVMRDGKMGAFTESMEGVSYDKN
jgi:ABC-type sugar transport system ATPase subunit